MNKTQNKTTFEMIFFTVEQLETLPMVGLVDLYFYYEKLSRRRFPMSDKIQDQVDLLNAQLTNRVDEYWEQDLLIEDVEWYEKRAETAAKALWSEYMYSEFGTRF